MSLTGRPEDYEIKESKLVETVQAYNAWIDKVEPDKNKASMLYAYVTMNGEAYSIVKG